jgi:hypothetical protein
VGGHKVNFSFTEGSQQGFCLVAGQMNGYAGPFVRPYAEGYPGITPSCPAFSGATDSPDPNYCSRTRYDWQVAGVDAKSGNFGDSYNTQDRSSDTGYDFVYIKNPPPTCGGITTSPKEPEVGQNFTVSGVASYSSGSTLNYNWTAKLNNVTHTGKGVAPDSQNTTFKIDNAGSYAIDWTIDWGSGSKKCTGTINVGAQPYLKVYGNDVSVGDPMALPGDKSCNLDSASKSTILSLADKRGTAYAGSSTQLAAYALGEIASFFSAGQQTGSNSPPVAPNGLTFGNYGQNGRDSGYGGQSGMMHCATNYYSILTQYFKTPKPASSILASNDGYYKAPSSGPLLIGGQIISGQHAIVVDGDVEITSDINYAGASSSSPQDLPSLYIVASGNIYIDSGVKNLSGVLVAQPNKDKVGQSGTIYTCADQGQPVDYTKLYDQCRSQLTINGAFIAQNAKFLRSYSTKGQSIINEGAGNNQAAELFKASPQMYLSAPAALQKAGSGSTYDSISSLPPIL